MTKWHLPSNPPDTGRPVLLWGQFVLPEFGGPEPLVGTHTDRSGWLAPDTQTGGFFVCEPMFWAEIEPPTDDR